VVDDNVDAAEMMKAILEMDGHEVCLAHDATSALATLGAFEPEIALLDIGLPGMDGYDLARGLRAHPRASRAFLVAVTGWGQDDDRQRARDAGFDAHLTKPANPADVERLVAAAPWATLAGA
jgi:CheY-like chemotaxis protein